MRSYDEAYAAFRDTPAFSNSTDGEVWMGGWCERCTNDSPDMVDRGEGCPLILIALVGRTPSEWLDQPEDRQRIGDRYHCVEFRDRDEAGEDPAPHPLPQCDGQLDIIDAYVDTAISELTPAPAEVTS